MICPDCGEKTHRSRARGFKESALKRFTSTRFHRCSHCGWRGNVKSEDMNGPGNVKLTLLIWILGILLALAIGLFGVSRLNSSVRIPPTTDLGDRQ